MRPPQDTARFEAEAAAGRCGRPGLGLLLRGSEGGNGVMIWLRPVPSAFPESLASGEFPLLARADSLSTRGATVAVRFMVGEIAHGVTLDSGAVTVTAVDSALGARVRGSGVDVLGAGPAGRVSADASFESVPLDPDTVRCEVRS